MTSPLERCQWSSLPQLSGNTKRNRSEEQQQEKEEKKRSCLISRRWLERTSSWSSPSSPFLSLPAPSPLCSARQLNSTQLSSSLNSSSAQLSVAVSRSMPRLLVCLVPLSLLPQMRFMITSPGLATGFVPGPALFPCTVPYCGLCVASQPPSPPLIFLSSSCLVPVCRAVPCPPRLSSDPP
jgi:hypothetical protein